MLIFQKLRGPDCDICILGVKQFRKIRPAESGGEKKLKRGRDRGGNKEITASRRKAEESRGSLLRCLLHKWSLQRSRVPMKYER